MHDLQIHFRRGSALRGIYSISTITIQREQSTIDTNSNSTGTTARDRSDPRVDFDFDRDCANKHDHISAECPWQ